MNRTWRGVALGVVLGVVAISLAIGGSSLAQNETCLSTSGPSEHQPWGRPDGTPADNELIAHHDYELSQNSSNKFADWVAYRLDGSTISGQDRPRNYRLDPCVPASSQISDSEFDGAYSAHRYDRGHLAPSATFSGSQYWSEVNFMTNIAPMHQTLNRGVWARLEAAIRSFVKEGNTVYVLAGPLYEQPVPELPNADKSHLVPSDYWKIVLSGNPDNPSSVKATAFLFDQYGCVEASSCSFNPQFQGNRVAIDTTELLSAHDMKSGTKLDFFPDLPDNVEAKLEAKVGSWPPEADSSSGGY